jgi:hypothetical protein
VDADLDSLVTALYVKIDDTLKDRPELAPWRPKVGIAPKLSDAELVTLAVAQVLLGFDGEARWVRYARAHLRHLFPYMPGQAGYNKRLRKSAGQLAALVRVLGQDTDSWADDVWLVDSTPVECARSRPTVKRSNLAGWAGYGYCASHSRYFWGLRLHLVATLSGLPVAFALAHPKTDEREVALAMFDTDVDLLAGRHAQTLLADKGYRSAEFEAALAGHGIEVVRPAFTREPPRRGAAQLRKFRQVIESVFDTLKGQLSLEAHHAHSAQGVATRVAQRLLALTAAVWHNHHTGRPILRSLTAYDH